MAQPNKLHAATLKVRGIYFVEGQEFLESVVENPHRRYPLNGNIHLVILTNQGDLHVETKACFEFDGRSGPRIVDWYVPNLGSIEERASWYVHDCNGYALDLNFHDTNLLLYAMLRDLAHYRESKARLVRLMVSLSKGWYGTPKDGDWCNKNVGKVSTTWIQKEK